MSKDEQVKLDIAKMEPTCSNQVGQIPICRLLLIQMIFGVTYGGNCPFFKNHPTKKIILISYDCLTTIAFLAFQFFAFSNDVFNRQFADSPHKGIMFVLFKFAAFSMTIEYLSIKILMMKNGWTTIHKIKSLGMMTVSNIHFRLIVLYLTMMTLTYGILFPVNFSHLDNSFNDIVSHDKLRSLCFLVIGLFYAMNKTSIGSISLFMALALQQIIKKWTEDLKNESMKVRQLCESILDLRQGIEEINSNLGLILFIKVFVNAMIIPSALCSIFVGKLPPHHAVCITGFAIACLVDIIVICCSSQIMIDAMSELCKEVEKMLILNTLDRCSGKQLYLILSMKNYIRLNVMCLFDLKTMTVLAIIGNIANYAIIVIETTVPDIK